MRSTPGSWMQTEEYSSPCQLSDCPHIRRSRPSEPVSLWQSNAIRPATYRTLCQERPCFVSRKLPPKSSACGSQPDPLTNASSLEGETKCPEKTALISHFPRSFPPPPLVSFGQTSHPDSLV